MSVGSASVVAARRLVDVVDRLLEHPREVVGALIVAQIVATLVFAFSVTHNGWVYFHGGDQIWLTTTGWLLGQAELPQTEIGYLWPLVQTPITWVTGATYVQALPALVFLNTLVLAPIAIVCIYRLAAAIGGRLLGYWAALLWVVAPFASIPLFIDRYHEKWVDHFLPQALGLTAMADFPSMVLVLVAATFVVRSLVPGRLPEAVLAGLLLGAAGGLKPPNLLLGVGAGLAYLVARRWREGAVFAVAVVPSLLILAFWKQRGLGAVPALSLEEVRVASSAGLIALDISPDRYLDLDVEHWRQQMNELREFFWSARLAQWAPIAGLVAVLRVRRGAIAALLGGWLGAFIVVKGFSPLASIQTNTFWRLLMPAWPAYLVLLASIPVLVPTLVRRMGDRARPPELPPLPRRWVGVAAALVLAIPAAAIAVAAPLEDAEKAVLQQDVGNELLTPVDDGIDVRATRSGDSTHLAWETGADWRADVFYRVYRTSSPGPDTECNQPSGGGAADCVLTSSPIATTRDPVYVDRGAPPGTTYRIGIGTNWADDPEQGDVFVVSPPVVPSG